MLIRRAGIFFNADYFINPQNKSQTILIPFFIYVVLICHAILGVIYNDVIILAQMGKPRATC